MTHSVILVDDHPLLLRGLQSLLGTAPDFEIVAATTSGANALSVIRERQPDLALVDIAMPDTDGLQILEAVFANRWPVRVIVLSATLKDRQIADALALDAWGILLKEYAPDALLDCMRQVAGGEKWLPAELLARAARATRDDTPEKLNLLTAREREVAVLICSGLSNRAIAKRLGTSEGTIGMHLHNIYGKLDITNRTMLAALHVQYGTT